MRYPDLRRIPRRPAAWLLSLAVTIALTACGEVPTQVKAPTVTAQMATVTSLTQAPEVEKLYVCKDGPAGTYQFSAKVTSGSVLQQNGVDPVLLQDSDKDGDSEFTVDAGTCLWVGLAGGTPARVVEVTEAAHAGTDFVNTTIKQLSYGVVTTTTGGNPSSGTLSGSPALDGAVIIFNNTLSAPSLSIVKTADNATVTAGTNIGFGITVSSNGPGDANNVQLSDPLPTGTGISWSISTQPAQGSCSIASNTLSCTFGNMAAGTSVSVHIESATTAQSCGTYQNTATAWADNHGQVTANASTAVECQTQEFAGCTPGFWKQSQHFKYWYTYTTGQKINTVFNNTAGYNTDKSNLPIGDQTLLAGLSFKGGNSIGGAAEILLRAGIAGLLNAANPNVNYTMSAAQVITAVSNALASQDRNTILGLASSIDADNNRQCTAK